MDKRLYQIADGWSYSNGSDIPPRFLEIASSHPDFDRIKNRTGKQETPNKISNLTALQ
jgi:hypothetical protein